MQRMMTLLTAMFMILVVGCSVEETSQKSPNFIFILTDDQGWSSTSVGMDDRQPDSRSDFFETPNIDRMAKSGVRFTRGYAPAAICSPTRRAIQFGQSPARLGDETFKDNYDPKANEGLVTIPIVLKSVNAAYKAAHFGKWDLRADIFPEDMGYDESDGDTRNMHGNLMSGDDDKWADFFVSDDPKRTVSITRRAVNFMERQVKQGNPFYLQVSHYAPHVDIQARQATMEKYDNREKGEKHNNPGWAAMLEDMDASIGELLDQVEHLGIMENTYIIFMADNGSVEFLPPVKSIEKLKHPDTYDQPMRNFPLRGGKWTLYEGGIRVPFMVSGPGVPRGMMSHEVVGGVDILPTIAELVGYTDFLPASMDGGSFAGILDGKKGKVMRRNDFFVFHRYNKGYPHSALIRENYKVIRFWKTGGLELYNLEVDLGERNNIYEEEPEKAKELYTTLTTYLEEVNPVLMKELISYKQE